MGCSNSKPVASTPEDIQQLRDNEQALNKADEELIRNRRPGRDFEFVFVTDSDLTARVSSVFKKWCMVCKSGDERLAKLKFWEMGNMGKPILSSKPTSDQLYIFHPYDDEECIPSNHYWRMITLLKIEDIKKLFFRLGAKEFSSVADDEENKDRKVGAGIGVADVAKVEGRYENRHNRFSSLEQSYSLESPVLEYVLRKPGSQREILFDLEGIKEGIKFIEDDDLKEILTLRKKNVGKHTSSVTFNEEKLFSVAAKLLAFSVGSLAAEFKDNPETKRRIQISIEFFPKDYFTNHQRFESFKVYDDSDEKYGKLVKADTLYVNSEEDGDREWHQCEVSLRGKGFLVISYPSGEVRWYEINQHRLKGELVVLPDDARRSRESKYFPISIPVGLPGESGKLIVATDKKEGTKLWHWASLIRWLFEGPPEEEKVPFIDSPLTTSSHHPYYVDRGELQDILLRLRTYKNYPKEAMGYDEFETKLHREDKIKTLQDVISGWQYLDQDRFDTLQDVISLIHNRFGFFKTIQDVISWLEVKCDAGKTSPDSDETYRYSLPDCVRVQGYYSKNEEDLKKLEQLVCKFINTREEFTSQEESKQLKDWVDESLKKIVQKASQSLEVQNYKYEYSLPDCVRVQGYYSKNEEDLKELEQLLCEVINSTRFESREDSKRFEDWVEERLKKIVLKTFPNTEFQNYEYSLPDCVHRVQGYYSENEEDLKKLQQSVSEMIKTQCTSREESRAVEERLKEDLEEIVKNSLRTSANEVAAFGAFAYKVICGSCIQVNEECFELILSTNLYNFKAERTTLGNSPLSLVCEGNYDECRRHIIERILDEGKALEGAHAGMAANDSFVRFLCKPQALGRERQLGSETAVGAALNEKDVKICQLLIQKGDGRASNEELEEMMYRASTEKKKEFTYGSRGLATKLIIPTDNTSFTTWSCETLTKLDLSQNAITEIPEAVYNFVNLTFLSFEENCLISISQDISKLKDLKTLKLANNLIEELPASMENLSEVKEFSCHDNPIKKPPKEIWSKGIEDIRRFFERSRKLGTSKNLDVRVLVLGLSEAGKTSMIKGLLNSSQGKNESSMTRKGDRTIGIERTVLEVPRDESEDPANVIVFDFAGQQEYYITHHIFLSKRSLYVIAFNLHEHKSNVNPFVFERQILLWWETIENRVCDIDDPSATPKIILVGTHADLFPTTDEANERASRLHKAISRRIEDRRDNADNEKEKLMKKLKGPEDKPNENQKKALHKQIHAIDARLRSYIRIPESIIAMSSADSWNIDEVRKAIARSLDEEGPSGKYFPELGEELPNSYFRVRKFIRDYAKSSVVQGPLDLDSYYEKVESALGIGREDAKDATEFCHNLGDVLFYDKIGVVFLQPEFLIDAFKAIIRHDHNEATTFDSFADGIVDKNNFDRMKSELVKEGKLRERFLRLLWGKLNIPRKYEKENIYGKMIDLLETFDVAYVAKRNKDGKPLMLHVPEFQPEICDAEKWPPRAKQSDHKEIQRWIYLPDKNPPMELLKRLQVRLFTSEIIKPDKSYLSQRQIGFVNSNDVELFVTSSGTEEFHFNDSDQGLKVNGLRLHIRCDDEEKMWNFFGDFDRVLKSLFRDWKGLAFAQKVVHKTSEGHFLLCEVSELETEREEGNEFHSFKCVRDEEPTYVEKVAIKDLLGPIDIDEGEDPKLIRKILNRISL